MADELPSGNKAVFAFLELFAFAFAFEGAEALLNGKSWEIWIPAFAAAAVFFWAGIKFAWIKGRFLSIDWNLWDRRIKWLIGAMLVVALLSFMALVATIHYEWGRASKTPIPKPQNAPAADSKSNTTPSTKHVDWHDKQNWRQNLHRGMTRTEVRRLFGDPEKMWVYSSSEVWVFGSGEVDFDMEDHPDGSLYGWFEPSP